MPLAFFYPAGDAHPDREQPPAVHVGSYAIEAVRDAAIAEGRFPLVVVSHGHNGSLWGHHDLCEALARAGYVVVAPEHVGDSYRDQSAFRTDRMLLGRANQASAAIDATLADSALGPHVDASRIGAAGFSAGGYTSLLLVGAHPDFTRIKGYCDRHPKDDDFCGHHETAAVARASPPPTADARVGAVFAMAPLAVYFGPDAFAAVHAPVFLAWSTRDEVLLPAENAENVLAGASTIRGRDAVEGAGHFVFLAPCASELAAAAPQICTDAPGIDRAQVHARLDAEAVRFFDQALRTQDRPR